MSLCSPQGERVRSRVELISVLERIRDLSGFDFKSGKFLNGVAPPIRIRRKVWTSCVACVTCGKTWLNVIGVWLNVFPFCLLEKDERERFFVGVELDGAGGGGRHPRLPPPLDPQHHHQTRPAQPNQHQGKPRPCDPPRPQWRQNPTSSALVVQAHPPPLHQRRDWKWRQHAVSAPFTPCAGGMMGGAWPEQWLFLGQIDKGCLKPIKY